MKMHSTRTALSVYQFLSEEKQTPVLKHPPYSPHLSPCDFFQVPSFFISLKGQQLKLLEEKHSKVLSDKHFQQSF
jgi:hypothetical protein